MAIQLTPFENAIASLEEALRLYSNSQLAPGASEKILMRDGVIQRFEYTFELSWKMLKRYLEEFGLERVDQFTNRDLFRAGAEAGLLTDAEAWINYLHHRNLTSHTYNAAVAQDVYEAAVSFLADARHLLAQLKTRTS